METTQPSNLSRATICAYAERIGQHYRAYAESGRVDMDKLLGELGGTVDISSSLFGAEALTVRGEQDFTIHLPPATSDRRDRFTIAHELGHYFLHYLYPERENAVRFSRGGSNRAETEANYFAASLLMPEESFKAAHQELGANPGALAARFGVSPRAAEVRIESLRLS